VLEGIRIPTLEQQSDGSLTNPDQAAENGSGQGWSGIPSTVSLPSDDPGADRGEEPPPLPDWEVDGIAEALDDDAA
jgi:hypothetical protein